MAKVKLGNVKGPKGDQGGTGATGPQGPQGPTGPTGPKGATGARGSQWYTGTAVTGTSTTPAVFPGTGIAAALVGDIYLNTSNGNVYHCTTAGAAAVAKWAYAGCIRGLQGPQGPKGATGATGATGPQGNVGATGPQGPKGDKGDPTTVDAVLSASSTNPIQNKAVATKFQDVQDSLASRAQFVDGVKDLDAIQNKFCLFTTDESPNGSPIDAGLWFSGIQFKLNDNWMTQVLFPIGSTSVYTRAINNAVRHNWVKVGP